MAYPFDDDNSAATLEQWLQNTGLSDIRDAYAAGDPYSSGPGATANAAPVSWTAVRPQDREQLGLDNNYHWAKYPDGRIEPIYKTYTDPQGKQTTSPGEWVDGNWVSNRQGRNQTLSDLKASGLQPTGADAHGIPTFAGFVAAGNPNVNSGHETDIAGALATGAVGGGFGIGGALGGDLSALGSASGGMSAADAATLGDLAGGAGTADTVGAAGATGGLGGAGAAAGGSELGTGLTTGSATGGIGSGELGTGLTAGTTSATGAGLGAGVTSELAGNAGLTGSLGALSGDALANAGLAGAAGLTTADALNGLNGLNAAENVANNVSNSSGDSGSGSSSGSGSGSGMSNADWTRLLGTLGQIGGGLFGANELGNSMHDIAQQQHQDWETLHNERLPFLNQGTEWLTHPNTYLRGPAARGAINQTLRGLSVTGNPVGSPLKMEMAADAGLKNWQNAWQGAGAIGTGTPMAPQPTAAMAGAQADASGLNAIGYGIGNYLNPQPSLADFIKQLRAPGPT